jgi:hypothetical protein
LNEGKTLYSPEKTNIVDAVKETRMERGKNLSHMIRLVLSIIKKNKRPTEL